MYSSTAAEALLMNFLGFVMVINKYLKQGV